MNDQVELLDKELAALCKGRGMQEPRILDRLGPAIREALGIRYGDDAAEQRHQLQVGLYDASAPLAPDLRVVFRYVTGFDRKGPHAVGEREAILGRLLNRDARTVRRRFAAARRAVAENLATRLGHAVSNNRFVRSGWHVESLRSVVRMDLASPQVTEYREIIATEEGLSRIAAHMSLPSAATVPADRPPLEIVAEQGCVVKSSERISASHWGYELDLPEPLQRGQRHHYVVTYIASSLDTMRPYYALVPFRDVRFFAAEVHFGSPSVARYAWYLDGVSPAVLDDAPIAMPDFDTDASPIVAVEFERAQPGLCYGLLWNWRSEVA